jgi:hypothetical protein
VLKGTHAALPPSSAVFLVMAQFREILRHLYLEGSRMISKAPSHEFDEPPDDKPQKLQVVTRRPKATFHWPPDCLWPFMDDAPGTDT